MGYDTHWVSRSLHSFGNEVFRTLLAEERLKRGLTQVALAGQLACPQSVISKVERGDRRLDFVEFMTWAAALGLDVTAFIERYRLRVVPVPNAPTEPD